MQRHLLIADLLRGRRDTIHILADLIEEEGDPALAERTRGRKLRDRKLLRLALELVTYPMGLQLTIDFFEHAMTFGDPVELLEPCFDHVRTFCEKINASNSNLAREQLEMARNGLESLRAVATLGTPVNALIQLLEVSEQLYNAACQGDQATFRRKNNNLRSKFYEFALLMHHFPAIRHRNTHRSQGQPYQRYPYTGEQLSWQLQHMEKVLSQA